MSNEPIRLNDILRRAAALPIPLRDGSASTEEITRSYSHSLSAGYEMLGKLELVSEMLREGSSWWGMLVEPGGLEERRASLSEAEELLRSLAGPFQALRGAASLAPPPFAAPLMELSERLSGVVVGTLGFADAEKRRLDANSPEPDDKTFPARPSPMTPEEAEAFRRDFRKRADKILAALAE